VPYAINDGTRIWWTAEGHGPPLLLLMGFGHSSELWGATTQALAEQFRVLRVDNRGTGRSDRPRGRYSIDTMASDAVAVLQAAGLERAHVFGVSLGSVVAQEMAITYPERVDRLVLGCGMAPGKDARIGSRLGLTLVLLKPLLPDRLAARVLHRYLYDPATPSDTAVGALTSMGRAQAPFMTCLRQSLGQLGYESSHRLDRVIAPTLILHGEHDRLAPLDNADLMHQKIAGSRLVVLPDAAHSIMTDAPERTVKEVATFLSERNQPDRDGGAEGDRS
jgi:pimeloyl-ACP methyl ester carboxylesterase